MISRIHNRLGTAGFVISIIALVAAMTGGAYAALSSADKSFVKKESKKFSKQFSKQFAIAGPVGPAGPPGAPGKDGANGKDGAAGQDGADGTSPTTETFAGTKGSCTNGGITVKSASSPVNVCNGKNGEDGEDGETGFTETLPPGETETGAWALSSGTQSSFVPLSFNIPLAEAPESTHFVNKNGEEFVSANFETFTAVYQTPVNCLGTVEAPTAPSGMICIYAKKQAAIEGANLGFINSTEDQRWTSGATFQFLKATTTSAIAWGTWAVTAK